MSSDWKKCLREEIVCSKGAKNTSHILPQDSDIELVYRRAVVFNFNIYWNKEDLHAIPCDEVTGYKERWTGALCDDENVKQRQDVLAPLNAR